LALRDGTVQWRHRLRQRCPMESSTPSLTPDPSKLRAVRKHVRRLRYFYRLCLTAALVIALTAVINVVTSPNRLWFLWVVPGFAIALGLAALDTFGRNLWPGRDWQERKVREFLARQAG
jgi:2TM domain